MSVTWEDLWPEPLREAAPYRGQTLTDLAADVDTLLAACGKAVIREHVPRVAGEAEALAGRFGVDPALAQEAALLHDLGGSVPREAMLPLSERLGLPVCPEERQVPLLLHAGLSVVIARRRYGVHDPAVLQAIRVHTTLHARPTPLDLTVFLADKLEWDQGGVPPYGAELRRVLDGGLRVGARWMLAWLASPPARLLIPHPDLRAAWEAFGIQSSVSTPGEA